MEKFSLDKFDKIGAGFRTPEGYFDDFDERLFHRMHDVRPKRISKFWHIAAAVLAVGLSVPIYQHFSSNIAPQDTDIERYFSVYPPSDDALAEMLDETDFSALEADFGPDQTAIEDMYAKHPDLEDYIIN